MKYNEILEKVYKVNELGEKTGFEFEYEYCPVCGSNQYSSENLFCLTCEPMKTYEMRCTDKGIPVVRYFVNEKELLSCIGWVLFFDDKILSIKFCGEPMAKETTDRLLSKARKKIKTSNKR